MTTQDGRHSEMVMQLHVTSQRHNADVKGDTFRHTIYPPSVVVIAFIFSELRRGGRDSPHPVVEDQKKPGLNRVKSIRRELFHVRGLGYSNVIY